MITRSLRLLVLAFVTSALVAPAHAVPTVRGATGLIRIPTAELAQSSAIFLRQEKIGTGLTQGFTFVEGGVQNYNGGNLYDGKLQLLPDITNENEWIPGVALGMRGVGNNVDREWYAVVSKHFVAPEFHAAWGLSRRASWSRGQTKTFYGVEIPLFFGLSVLAEHDNHTDQTHAGVRFRFMKHFVIYDYLEDARRKVDRSKRNIIGACYQSHF